MKLSTTASAGQVRPFRKKIHQPRKLTFRTQKWRFGRWFPFSIRADFQNPAVSFRKCQNLLPFPRSCSCTGRSHAKGKMYLLLSISNSCWRRVKRTTEWPLWKIREFLKDLVKFYLNFLSPVFFSNHRYFSSKNHVALFFASNSELLGYPSFFIHHFWISIPGTS